MTNDAAIGYAIISVRRMGLSQKLAESLEKAMLRSMDEHSEEEAEEVYRNS